MSNAFQWIEYSIINNIICFYYDVDELSVNWTSVVYMLVYIPLIFPAAWLLDRRGLRFVVLLGSFGTCLGSWVKCGSLFPSLFLVTMLGQTIVAVSQIFILGIPPQLAGVWFGDKEVSRACAVGVFGNQLGVALGFVVPPLLVPNSKDKDEITKGLSVLFYSIAAITSALFIAIVFLYKDKPPVPPSRQAALKYEERRSSYWVSVAKLIRNVNYILLLVTYGINVGVFYAISTLLNQMVLAYYPGEETSVGWMGLLIVLAGMLGSVVCGMILDKTHKYKQTTLTVYVLSTLGMIAFTMVLRYSAFWSLFLMAGLLGFFMTGYLPLGFEFAAEITYPEPEGTSSGLLNASAQFFGILFTISASSLLEKFGDIAANSFLSVTLVLGTIMTAVIKSDLRRQRASKVPVVEVNNDLIHQ